MDSGRRIADAGATRDETESGPACDLADCLGHDGSRTFVTADGQLDVTSMERIERGEIALARYAEYVTHALDRELIDQDFTARACIVSSTHVSSFDESKRPVKGPDIAGEATSFFAPLCPTMSDLSANDLRRRNFRRERRRCHQPVRLLDHVAGLGIFREKMLP